MSETDENSSVFEATIPVMHTSAAAEYCRPRRAVEQQMDREVEQVFREWDENVKCRKQASFHMRPVSSTSSVSAGDRTQRGVGVRGAKKTLHTGDSSARFEFPEIDIVHREDAKVGSSTEPLEDDSGRRQYYTESPVTGQRVFCLEFDVQGYDPEMISVRVCGTRLIVHAVQQEADSGRKTTTEFCRKVKLPNDVLAERLQCSCTNGRLLVQAPTSGVSSAASSSGGLSGPGTPTFHVSSPRVEPLNQPVFKVTQTGKTLSLTVELGRVFRAEDVVVKVKSQDKLVIQAHRKEDKPKSKMESSMTREFDLEEKIVPQSLKAGLTADGLLKVTAHVLSEVRVITNGVENEHDDDHY